jgi:ribonuclease J
MSKLKVIPLGGVGEIGRNMTILEYENKILVLDCGVLFPREDEPGVDLILPDFSYLEGKLARIEAIVITHGHEDHIGAIPYLLKMREDIPIISAPFTLALIENKLKEHRLKAKMIEVHPHDMMTQGDFELEFVQVNHSIPDALGVYVKTPGGTVFDTGDIKLDQTPLDKKITDLGHMSWISQKGIDLLLIDSTNAETPGVIPTESAIERELDILFNDTYGKIIVTCFASHVHRVQQIINCAIKYKRKVAFVGRSMAKNIPIAKEYGLIKYPDELLIDPKQIDDFPSNRLVLIVTGSQGEPMAALSRISNDDHSIVSVDEGDNVILASSIIPGNEKSIFRVMNNLAKKRIKVYNNRNSKIHVSGHAAKTDLQVLYNVLRPKSVMPVHGEPMHLAANVAIAKGVGIKNAIQAEDGFVLEINQGKTKVVDKIENRYVFVDGKNIGGIDNADLKDRQVLSKEGFISLYTVVDEKTRKVVIHPHLIFRGVAEDKSSFSRVLEEIVDGLEKAMSEGNFDTNALRVIAQRTLGRYVGTRLKRAPILVVQVAKI